MVARLSFLSVDVSNCDLQVKPVRVVVGETADTFCHAWQVVDIFSQFLLDDRQDVD